MTIVHGAVCPLLMMNGLLVRLQIRLAPIRDLAGLVALLNPRLFIAAARIDMVALVVCRLTHERGGRQRKKSGGEKILGKYVHEELLCELRALS